MRVAIVGGHGKIARHLARILTQNGDEAISIVRKREQFEAVRVHGGEPVLCDVEAADAPTLAEVIAGADAVVFAAGAGPGSGAERKETVDFGGAVTLIEAAKFARVPRYVMISAVGADSSHPGDEVFDVYLRAKGRADDELVASGLDHTVLRPVGLTDEPGTGHVALAADRDAKIPREDVAAAVAVALAEPATIGRTYVLASGDTPISEALRG
ncbi:SDR family oxidoreductase [Egicoccus sp. AB-alg6-2]|uniref:SDR family oxidoreductase n=1 Tax=Egicoccus sp. AB-alg6-2 TaxID=3242692 RepID=UPI00359E134E